MPLLDLRPEGGDNLGSDSMGTRSFSWSDALKHRLT